jgi:hypothetical protein
MEIRDGQAEDAPAACLMPRRSIAELCVADHRNDPTILARWLSLTSIIGIGVGTIMIARWDGALDIERARRILDGEVKIDADAPEHSPALEPSVVCYTPTQ